ncbi:MAG: phosphatidate cytidylyltransferase [Treponema sp.]|jgi:dolichol kinase|nr:phosphatidate cytidylyltransferase [Treponema sp.]
MNTPRLLALQSFQEIKTETTRKGLHLLIALVPGIASISFPAVKIMLLAGILLYTWLEILRLSGIQVPLVSAVTKIASRPRDEGRFVMGPVTLAFGALLALILFPFPAASAAIYALAFGDSFASLVGRFFGRIRPAFMFGKSLEGSAACFIAVLTAAFQVSGSLPASFTAAAAATLVEALPLQDYDNLALPLAAGFAVQAFL